MKRFNGVRWFFVFLALAVSAGSATWAQSPVSGVFFSEGWESGSTSQSFNSRFYGNALGGQFGVNSATRATGSFSLRHALTAGLSDSAIAYATQHFGDAHNGPVLPSGSGQHFTDMYIQYKVYYSSGFDLSQGRPKQLIIGTEDDRRHDNVCCNPWVSHYMTVVPPHNARGSFVAEANNKQAASGQWIGFVQNRSGYSEQNLLVTQTGRWYTMEVRRRLNDAGVNNGVFQMWVDGVLLSEHTDVRYRIPWNGTFGANMTYGTNFVMISDHMAIGSTRDQSVYYDDVKFSTTYIGLNGGDTTLPAAPRNLRVVPGAE